MRLFKQHPGLITVISFLLILGSIWVVDAKTKEETYQEKLARLKPDDVDAQYQLGLWCEQNKLPDQAKKQFEKVIELSPNHVEARAKLGYIKYKGEWIKREEKARLEYEEKLTKLKADDINGHYQLGLWCKQNKLPEQSKTEFEKVIKLDSEHPGARKELGQVKYKGKWIKQGEEKRTDYQEKLAQLAADDGKGHYELAVWCKQQGLADESVAEFEKVIKLDPDHVNARTALGYQKHDGKWMTEDEIMGRIGVELKVFIKDDMPESFLKQFADKVRGLANCVWVASEGNCYIKKASITDLSTTGNTEIRNPYGDEIEPGKWGECGGQPGNKTMIVPGQEGRVQHAGSFLHEFGHFQFDLPDEYNATQRGTKPCIMALSPIDAFCGDCWAIILKKYPDFKRPNPNKTKHPSVIITIHDNKQ